MLQGIHEKQYRVDVSYGYDPPQHNNHSYRLPIDSTSHIDKSSCFGRVVCIGRLIEGATKVRLNIDTSLCLEKTLLFTNKKINLISGAHNYFRMKMRKIVQKSHFLLYLF